jgi:UDP-N-acetylmuramate dehydrogenase
MKIKQNVNLAPFNTFGLISRAEYFCQAKNVSDLISAVEFAKSKKIRYRIFGEGSNVVFPDGKLEGLLIKMAGGRIIKKGNLLIVDAGVPLIRVVKETAKSGLAGIETLAGIPGTLGGAIVGNAGAYGHAISEVVAGVKVWDGKKFFWVSRRRCQFGYRESIFKHKSYIVLCAALKFKKGDPKNLKKIYRQIIKIRLKKYRPGLRCPGSFFKNILVKNISKKTLVKINPAKIIEGKIPAGYLLEEVGAKGMSCGGIKIADFHGNLFINRGGGTAADIKKLAQILKRRVYKKFGIELEEEIRYF